MKVESYKLPEVVSGDDRNLRAEPPSWSRGGPIVEGAEEGNSWALFPETKHLRTCQSILLAILLKNLLKMLRNHSARYIFTHR